MEMGFKKITGRSPPIHGCLRHKNREKCQRKNGRKLSNQTAKSAIEPYVLPPRSTLFKKIARIFRDQFRTLLLDDR
jgi:hypothetical protein